MDASAGASGSGGPRSTAGRNLSAKKGSTGSPGSPRTISHSTGGCAAVCGARVSECAGAVVFVSGCIFVRAFLASLDLHQALFSLSFFSASVS